MAFAKVSGVHARSAVGDAQRERVVQHLHGDFDPRILAVARVHGVVDEVADHGDHLLAGQRHIVGVRRQAGVLGDGQLDAAFVGLGGLAQQQCDQRGLADGAGQPVDELLGQRELFGGELHRIVGSAHLDHRDDGVQLVGRLVRLRPQGVGEHLQRAEFAQRALQFGAVADRDDLRGVSVGDVGTVHHQDTVGGDVHLVARTGSVGAQELRQVGAVDRPGRQREQSAGLVVDQCHTVAVQHDQPLRHRMQDRVVVLVHHPQLVGPQPVRLPQQPTPDHPHPSQAKAPAPQR